MAQEFEHILEDNRCLKKELQLIRHQNDKLQQQLSQLRFSNQELLDKNTQLNHLYNQLQKKNQLQLAEYNKDINTLTSQIEELKMLIDQKQQEMESFQIKIIPNLDQDMLRVKLITEMEGPYQEAVEKKEREITRLKQKLIEAERKYNISELQLTTKEKEFKRELADAKSFYQAQNEKLLKELNCALNKKEVKSYDKELFKSQRKELEELRCTISLQEKNEAELRKQLTNTKLQKEKLLLQICHLNQRKALEEHLSPENVQLRSVRQNNHQLEEELSRKNSQIEKLQKRIRSLEKEYKTNQDDLKQSFAKSKEQWQNQKDLLSQELTRQKEENLRARLARERREEDFDRLNQTLRSTQGQLQLRQGQCLKLKQTISNLEKDIHELQQARKRKLSLTKDLINEKTIQKSQKKQNQEKKANEAKDHAYIKQLQKSNHKLKEKLELANKKIVELLKQKAAGKPSNQPVDINSSISRDRAFTNIEIGRPKPTRDILLEYRDTSLTPLVQPTIFTRQPRT